MRTRPRQTQNFGVAPTAQQKLIHVSKRLGLPGMAKQQGALFNLFDTVSIPASTTGRTTLSFFTSTANKSRTFTNLQLGTLQAGESIVAEYIQFYLITTSLASLTDDANVIGVMLPLSTAQAGLSAGLMSFKIANDTVVKDYMSYETNPEFNSSNNGVAVGTTVIATPSVTTVRGCSFIRLESNPVIPPNQKVQVTLELPAYSVLTGLTNASIVCVIGRTGSIFSSKTTL